MRYAYADPPYYGYSVKFYSDHPEAHVYDTLDGHHQLIDRLCVEFDGWALSMTSGNLRDLLPLCPPDVRVAAWTKPFASFKPGVNPGYCWEPVVFWGARRRTDRSELTVRDFCAVPITLRKGFTGAKPYDFVTWVLDLLGARPDDDITDLFPGSGAVTNAIDTWRRTRPLPFSATPTPKD